MAATHYVATFNRIHSKTLKVFSLLESLRIVGWVATWFRRFGKMKLRPVTALVRFGQTFRHDKGQSDGHRSKSAGEFITRINIFNDVAVP